MSAPQEEDKLRLDHRERGGHPVKGRSRSDLGGILLLRIASLEYSVQSQGAGDRAEPTIQFASASTFGLVQLVKDWTLRWYEHRTYTGSCSALLPAKGHASPTSTATCPPPKRRVQSFLIIALPEPAEAAAAAGVRALMRWNGRLCYPRHLRHRASERGTLCSLVSVPQRRQAPCPPRHRVSVHDDRTSGWIATHAALRRRATRERVYSLIGYDLNPRAVPLKPYLGLNARLSLSWLSQHVLALLLVLITLAYLLSAIPSLVRDAKQSLGAACQGVQGAANVAVSMPHYMAAGVNELNANAINALTRGAGTALDLLLQALQAIVL